MAVRTRSRTSRPNPLWQPVPSRSHAAHTGLPSLPGVAIMSDIYDRPRQTVEHLNRIYPGVWEKVDSLRAARRELGDWPSWCFMPIDLFRRMLGNGAPLLTAKQHKHATFLGAVAAWRWTQGIYRFDPSTFDALWNTPVTGEIPIEVLYCMPEWCVFIPTPEKTWHGHRLNGFFAHLNQNLKMRRTELRLLLDIRLPDGTFQADAIPIILGTGGVAESLASTLQWSAQPDPLATPLTEQERAMERKEVPSLVSLVRLSVFRKCGDPTKRRRRSSSRVPETRENEKRTSCVCAERPDAMGGRISLGRRLEASFHRTQLGSSGGNPREPAAAHPPCPLALVLGREME
jgi:hypothetical protein